MPAERCPVHGVALEDAPEHDVGRICPRCEVDRARLTGERVKSSE